MTVSLNRLAVLLIGLFALNNLLLWGFLGRPGLAVAGAVPVAGLLALLMRGDATQRIALSTVLGCFAAAALLLILGGEGRLLYANFDWQVRDAVLADLGSTRWPYAYAGEGGGHVLRAPIGMYLIPAILGGASQGARDAALLLSNSVMLGLLFALGAGLFAARVRLIALGVFVAFSGLDIVGTLLTAARGDYASFEHLERWTTAMQYSSAITQIFWVPQHAVAGWAPAILFLLWRSGRLRPAFFFSVIPLAALWSPLSLLGTVPFVIYGGAVLLVERRIGVMLIAAGSLGTVLAAPALAYLVADAGATASGFQWHGLGPYALFLFLEVGLWLMLVWHHRATTSLDRASFAIVAVMLLLLPLYGIGDGEDFMMRASIMPLALLACFVAQTLTTGARKPVLLVVLLLGAVTGLKEVVRVVGVQAAPPPQCTLVEVWTQQGERIAPIGTYVARMSALAPWLRPHAPTMLPPSQAGKRCWTRDWATPRRP